MFSNSKCLTPDFPIDYCQQGKKLAKSGSNKKNFNSANLILMSIGKSGMYHQIWIPNNLGFIVSDLVYIISIPQTNTCLHTYHIQVRKWRNEARRSHKLLSNFSAVDSRTKNPFGYPSKKINMIQLSTGDFFQLLYSLK